MIACPMCGNMVEFGLASCNYCDSDLKDSAAEIIDTPRIVHRTVNLEHGRPVVETALKRMENELDLAKLRGVKVVTLIHGYGSSGKGGKIRVECRKVLDHLLLKKRVNSVVYGEAFHRRSGIGKSLVRQYPDLERIWRSDFNNPGITVVVF